MGSRRQGVRGTCEEAAPGWDGAPRPGGRLQPRRFTRRPLPRRAPAPASPLPQRAPCPASPCPDVACGLGPRLGENQRGRYRRGLAPTLNMSVPKRSAVANRSPRTVRASELRQPPGSPPGSPPGRRAALRRGRGGVRRGGSWGCVWGGGGRNAGPGTRTSEVAALCEQRRLAARGFSADDAQTPRPPRRGQTWCIFRIVLTAVRAAGG